MKKFTFALATFFAAHFASAQSGNDTLLWADFETDPSTYIQFAVFPPSITADTNWYNYDMDGLSDGSSSGNRPAEWFWTTGFANVDSSNGVLASNSWTNIGSTPVENVLITKRLDIVDTTAILSWKSAPFQTPRYLDGYIVLISTTNNDPASFTDTLFRAAEYQSLGNANLPNDFASYDFDPAATANPMSPFVHGADFQYLEDNAGDSTRWRGVLRPFSVSLAQYAGQHIFIEFNHYTHDDNLLEIDDILVTGTAPNSVKNETNFINFGLNPNPARDIVNINFDLKSASDISIRIFDITGREVYAQKNSHMERGRIPVSTAGFASGVYQVQITAGNSVSSKKLVVGD